MKGYTDIEELDGDVFNAWQVDQKMKENGLHLIGIRIVRDIDSKGRFSDVTHYLVGKPVGDKATSGG